MCAIRRKIDDLGRVLLPQEIRSTLNFTKNQPLEIAIRRDKIILRKASSGCEEELFQKAKHLLCKNCIFEIGLK